MIDAEKNNKNEVKKAKDLITKSGGKLLGAILNKTDNQFRALMERKIAEAGNTYIWYNDRFWPFTADHDLLCPVEATVNYTCDIIKERYV